MKEYKTITWQIIFSYLSKAILIPLHLALFIVLTRFLSKEEWGIVSLFFVTIMLFGKYLTLGFPEYVVKEYSGLKAKIRTRKFSSVFSFELFIMIFFLILVLSILKPLLGYFNMLSYLYVTVFVVLTIFIYPLYNLLTNYLTSKQKIKSAEAFSLLANSWMIIIILVALFYNKVNLNALFGIRFLLLLFTFFCLWVFIKRKDALKIIIPEKKELKLALLFSLPLIPLFASEYFIAAGDRFLIGLLDGSASIGSYAFFYTLLSFILLLAILPTNMLFTYSAREFKKNKKKSNFFFNAGAKYSLLILIPALIGLFILRKEIITMISGPKYLNDLYILPFLILFPLLEYISHFYKNVCILLSKTKYLAVTYVSGGILNIVLNLILIPEFKLIGAAIATIITYVFLFILLFLKGRQFIIWDNSFIRIQNIFISSAIMGFILFFFHPTNLISKLLTILFGAVIYFVMLFLTKTFVKEEIDLIRSVLGFSKR